MNNGRCSAAQMMLCVVIVIGFVCRGDAYGAPHKCDMSVFFSISKTNDNTKITTDNLAQIYLKERNAAPDITKAANIQSIEELKKACTFLCLREIGAKVPGCLVTNEERRPQLLGATSMVIGDDSKSHWLCDEIANDLTQCVQNAADKTNKFNSAMNGLWNTVNFGDDDSYAPAALVTSSLASNKKGKLSLLINGSVDAEGKFAIEKIWGLRTGTFDDTVIGWKGGGPSTVSELIAQLSKSAGEVLLPVDYYSQMYTSTSYFGDIVSISSVKRQMRKLAEYNQEVAFSLNHQDFLGTSSPQISIESPFGIFRSPLFMVKKGISVSDFKKYEYLFTLIPIALGSGLIGALQTQVRQDGQCNVTDHYSCAGKIHNNVALPALYYSGFVISGIPLAVLLGKLIHYVHHRRLSS